MHAERVTHCSARSERWSRRPKIRAAVEQMSWTWKPVAPGQDAGGIASHQHLLGNPLRRRVRSASSAEGHVVSLFHRQSALRRHSRLLGCSARFLSAVLIGDGNGHCVFWSNWFPCPGRSVQRSSDLRPFDSSFRFPERCAYFSSMPYFSLFRFQS